MTTSTTHEKKVKALYDALAKIDRRQAFGTWLRQQRRDHELTQRQIALVLGGLQGQSVSRIESGIFRLGLDRLEHLFAPWSDGKWDWRWTGDGSFMVDGDTDELFAVERVVDAVAAGTGDSHIATRRGGGESTRLLLSLWGQLDSGDQGMVLGIIMRLVR